jgi:hypothetical protein
MTAAPDRKGAFMAVVAAFVWQGWLFLGVLIGLPILLAALLSRGRGK